MNKLTKSEVFHLIQLLLIIATNCNFLLQGAVLIIFIVYTLNS